jgi:hypothetical protein
MQFLPQHPDRELAWINWVFVNGSMTLTAYFGWTLGEDIFVLGIILALLFAAISRAAPLMTRYAAEYLATGKLQVAGICAGFAGLFFVADVLTNYGSAAAIREQNMVTAKNQNNLAGDARSEVTRLETRISEIRATTAWQSKYLSPEAYDPLIASKQLERDNEAKRKYCGRKCEAKTAELAELQANQANAQQRLALKNEMTQLERELVAAKLKAAETQTVASAALAQVKNLAGLLTLQTNPDEFSKTWTNNGIMAVAALIVSLGSVLTAMVLGFRTGSRRLEGFHEPRETPIASNPYLPDHRPPDVRASDPEPPTPLKPTDGGQAPPHGHQTTTIIASNGLQMPCDNFSAVDRALAQARAHLKKFDESLAT